jgi:hypothetical protein
MKDVKILSVRIDIALHQRVKQLAEKENRSLNAEIQELLKRGLESEATKQLRFFE